MPITISDAPDILPAKAKRIYVAAWNASYEDTCKDRSDRDECASKIAWSAVKTKFKKERDVWVAKKSNYSENITEFSMFIDKAVYNKEAQELRWHCVASDVEEDTYTDNMTLELFEKFLSRIDTKETPPEKYISEFWNGGIPYLSLSHYSDQNGKAVPGPVESVYIDGEKLKAKGTFDKTPLGLACFDAINADKHGVRKSDNEELDHPVRISIAFLDYAHKHKSDGEIFIRENLDDFCPQCLLEMITGKSEGKEYLDGHLIHLALTRIPVNKRTSMEVSKSMATRKDDSKSIVGEELAEEVEDNETQFKSEALVTMSEEAVEKAKDKKDEEDDEDEEKKKKDKKEEKSRHVLQDSVDALFAAYDEVAKSNVSIEDKLTALQQPFTSLSNVARAGLEGTTVDEVLKTDAINELRTELSTQIAELAQNVQILSQAVQDKSNVKNTRVPVRRSIEPQVQKAPAQPAQAGQPKKLIDHIRDQYQ